MEITIKLTEEEIVDILTKHIVDNLDVDDAAVMESLKFTHNDALGEISAETTIGK